jgi:hypothetical protein
MPAKVSKKSLSLPETSGGKILPAAKSGLGSLREVPVVIDLRAKVFEAFSNPLDLRLDEELAEEFGVDIVVIQRFRMDPIFMDPVNVTFHQALQHVKPTLFKTLIRDVIHGGRNKMASAKLLLQSMGAIGGDGTTVNVNLNGAAKDEMSSLTSAEVDSEIHRLLMETSPIDVLFKENKVVVAEYEAIEDDA